MYVNSFCIRPKTSRTLNDPQLVLNQKKLKLSFFLTSSQNALGQTDPVTLDNVYCLVKFLKRDRTPQVVFLSIFTCFSFHFFSGEEILEPELNSITCRFAQAACRHKIAKRTAR